MIGIAPSAAGAHAAPEKRESDGDYAMASLASGLDSLERCELTEKQWERGRELLKRFKAALQEQDN